MEFNVLCTVSFYYQPEIKKNRDANFPFCPPRTEGFKAVIDITLKNTFPQICVLT